MHSHILAFVFFFQSLVSCQQHQEDVLPVSADLGFQSSKTQDQWMEHAIPMAKDIIFQSLDGGQTWQDVSAGLPEGLYVSCVFAADGEVILGTGKGLYRSSTISPVPVWEKDFFVNEEISGITQGTNGRYYCSYENGVFQEIANAGIWISRFNNLEDKTIRTVLETGDGALFLGTNSGIYKSADGGVNWKKVYSGGMVLNLVASGDVLIGGGMQGVLRSTDGGEHWDNVLNDNIFAKRTGLLQNRFVTILGTEDPSVINPEGITSRLRFSADGGKTWQRMEQTLLPLQGMYDMDEDLSQARDLYDIIQVGEYLFCSFDTGIFRSSDQGKTWELVLPSTDKRVLSSMTVSGKVIYAIAGGGC
ncbi:MAG: exo-alpha-sialidase [Saprospiraceae bacterium]|nr:exo-alpha-sialidase [Saprospiraceae bacterium]